jgi:hypothetical protein
MDLKREEFRKYLEKEGILETLTKSLVIFDTLFESKSTILVGKLLSLNLVR